VRQIIIKANMVLHSSKQKSDRSTNAQANESLDRSRDRNLGRGRKSINRMDVSQSQSRLDVSKTENSFSHDRKTQSRSLTVALLKKWDQQYGFKDK
jgi:hypothetical protein